MQQTIERIDRLMAPMLNDEQASELHTVLVACLTEKGGNPRITPEFLRTFGFRP